MAFFNNMALFQTKFMSRFALFATFLIMVHQPYQAFGRLFYPKNTNVDDASQAGVCDLTVRFHGYTCQEFEVITDDDYILSVQRIPHGRAGGNGTRGPPVLLQHGVLVDGLTWLLNSPEESLAYILADNGYDVWVSNIRGTRFSRRHVTLSPNSRAYWNWSWDDLITHDLPSIINLIFKQTGQKIHYVGHSLGTLMALTSFSEGLEVDKVKSAVLLSPVAYLSHMGTIIGDLLARSFVGELITSLGLAEFNPNSPLVANLLKTLCDKPGVDCYNLLPVITGKNCCLNASTVDLVLKNEPQPTSTKNMVHLAQIVRYGRLRKYDYGGRFKNLEHYGEYIPPAYDLSKIPHDLPMFLSYGGQDALSDVKDVETLLGLLKGHDADKLQVQYVKDYAHADFIIGVTAKDVVYNQVIKFFKKLD
ncbi:lipase [Lithospermum erythrorhizon]|uniref:Lipase n=1 Tax=Lithospermum erythrorhizon TaxID=34254 RepID=A0AAV3PTN5_LITER